MPTTRVGVQAVTGSPGQGVDIDPARISATITNVGSVAVEYSTGGAWTSIAAAGSASVSCDTNALRLRRAVAGGYPTPVDIEWTAQSEGEANSLTAAQASSVSGAGMAAITNAVALKPFAELLLSASISEAYATGTGDSLFQLGGDTTNLSSDTLAETDGFLAQFRYWLNTYLGTPDGGQWIAAEAAPSDTRVANNATVPVNQFGPYNAYRASTSVITQRRAMAIQATGQSITFNVTGRYLDVEIWENTGTYVGTASWTVDGVAGGTINSNGGGGAADTYRTVRLDLGTDAAHTVVISWASGNTMITGATVTRGRGVVTRRFGYGGSKAATWAALTTKQIRTSFQTLVTHLHMIRLSYNDWNNQVADGTTITSFKASIQTLIDAALVNTNVRSVLLIADPPASTADTNPISYRAFSNALRELALTNPKVAFYDVDLAVNATYAAGNSAGLYSDFVHRSRAGFTAEAKLLAQAIYGMTRISS